MPKPPALKDSNKDYPLFGYRVRRETKKQLETSFEQALLVANKSIPPLGSPKKKNELFVEIIGLGLRAYLERHTESEKEK